MKDLLEFYRLTTILIGDLAFAAAIVISSIFISSAIWKVRK